MKSLPLLTALVATAFLAACASTTIHPTATPATPTPTATLGTTPTGTPVTTPTPTLNVTVSTTCSNVPANWGYPGGLPSGALLATVVWHGVKVGDYVDLGNEPPLAQITSNPFTLTAKALGELAITFTQGSWDWTVWGPDQATEVADGTLTVPACPGQSITPPSAPTPTPTASVQ